MRQNEYEKMEPLTGAIIGVPDYGAINRSHNWGP